MTLSRRAFLASVGAGAALAAATGAPALVRLARKGGRPLAGGFVDDDAAVGHRLRDGGPWPAPTRTERSPVVIVGGGIGGLSAAWQLERRGYRDFVLLELSAEPGGNARGGENDVSRYPWAAHYLPVPGPDAVYVRELCEELGLLSNGVWDERHLCFSPQERLFHHGEWRDGIEPTDALSPGARREFERFAALVGELRTHGTFRVPMAAGEFDSALDTQSFAAWLRTQDFRSPELRWYLEYCCRDDYGASLQTTSAWAGLHYFSARPAEELGPLTWPEGNAWIARKLAAKVAAYIRTRSPAHRIARRGTRYEIVTPQVRYLAEAVIVAAPLHVVPRILDGAPPIDGLAVSPWLVANLTLDRWPEESLRGAPPAWDNVIYDSPSLGYVVATHQSLRTQEVPTVWTWYHAFADQSVVAARRQLRDVSWQAWADWILTDLARAHPNIRDCVTRIDLKRHAHAMVRPVPGYLTGTTRARFATGGDRLYFAHSDVSGLSLFEEAQYRGVTAAEAALAAMGTG